MSTFVKGGSVSTPFGRNEYLRSTQDVKVDSYTVAAGSVPARVIDGAPGQKILQPGTVMAKITTGPDSGKIGPYSTPTPLVSPMVARLLRTSLASTTPSFPGSSSSATSRSGSSTRRLRFRRGA